jgi:sulfite oxidase
MNGAPLPPVHGFPLRLVAPGYIGARSVKWLKSITVQSAPSDNYFQAHAYKLFPPHIDKETVRWERGLMLGEMSLTSAICEPAAGARIPAGSALVRGYAMVGGERQVARVEVSADGGASWTEAQLLGDARAWTWRLWEAEVEMTRGRRTLIVRAVDSAANSQPPSVDQVWNFKGYMNNAWHRVDIDVV